ncbi:helix-turn-helix domain-containing protein [Bradyrhizobium sp. 173]|nr:helix-turn-helix domain-containing protein [Bradyrhizobium sp. 173]
MTDANYSSGPNMPASIARDIPDVAAIRQKFRNGYLPLTQQAFADGLGIPVKTLRHWEQGKRKPTGAALVLLRLVDREPALFEKMRKSWDQREMIKQVG